MINANNLQKINRDGTVTNITSDDIPEGLYNKYNTSDKAGKNIGDIVLRSSPEEVDGHTLLNGQILYAYMYPNFYQYYLIYQV